MAKAQQKRTAKKKQAEWGPYFWALVMIVVLMFGYSAYRIYQARPPVAEDLAAFEEKVDVVQQYPEMTPEPIERVTIDTHWNSEPPTSGPYLSDVEPIVPSFYTVPQPIQVLVYNLRLGHVVVYYNPEKVPAKQQEDLKGLVRQYEKTEYPVIAVPNQQQKYPLVATAWTRVLRLTEADVTKVTRFARDFRGKGPGE